MRRAFLVLLLLALSAAGFWWYDTRFPVRTASQAPQVLMVEPGQGALDVGASLYELGLVRHPQVFRWHVALRGDD